MNHWIGEISLFLRLTLPSEERGERRNRGFRSERPEKGDRPERGERPERGDRRPRRRQSNNDEL